MMIPRHATKFRTTRRLVFSLLVFGALAIAQSSGYSYMTYYFSSDGSRLYATTVTSGQMLGGSGNSHVYTAYTNIAGPPGTQAVGCGEQSSGNVPAEYYNSVERNCYIDVNVPGTYSLTTRGTAYCTAVSYFFYDTLYQVSPTTVVAPVIVSISPNGGLVTSEVPVTIVGSGFGASPAVSVTGGISVSNVSVNSDRTEITAKFQIPANQASSNETVTVAVGKLTATVSFKRTIPARMLRTSAGSTVHIVNGDVVDGNGNVRLSGRCGVYRNYWLQLVDNNAQPLTVASRLTETFSGYTSTIPGAFPPETAIFNISGSSVVDIQYIGTIYPTCPEPNDHESFDMHFSVKIGNITYNLTTVIHIDRGFYTSGVSPRVESTTATQ